MLPDANPQSVAGALAPLLVDRIEVARLLGVSPSTVETLWRRGVLPSIKLGARRLYDVADLRALVASRKRVTPAPD
ncbi:MAG: helix-turn-helix domain-containing protein [Phycisphaerales bacterium]|nr:helix-turn-helix domain-containing protein [Phycisphaerales bacterium]